MPEFTILFQRIVREDCEFKMRAKTSQEAVEEFKYLLETEEFDGLEDGEMVYRAFEEMMDTIDTLERWKEVLNT